MNSRGTTTADQGVRPALPIMGAVFLSFIVFGMAMPVLSLHVHDVLGFGPFVVGLVAGCQFAASLMSRLWAGHLADSKGPKHAVMLGLSGAVSAGLIYLLSLALLAHRLSSIALLLIGRAMMGGAESLIITGGMTWALGLVASSQAARSISWVGMAMFAAMAFGAPIGSGIYTRWTFTGIAISTIALPLIALTLTTRLRPYVPEASERTPIRSVLGAVALPGLGFTLGGITFGAITAFITLFFSLNHWPFGALAFTGFAAALIATRILAGHLPDRHGGARIALWFLIIEAGGMAVTGLATGPLQAIAGTMLAGIGFSLVFPGLALEAVRRAPARARGSAMGLYNAFFDLTLGVVSPALGLLADMAGMRSIFIASALAALLAVPVCVCLMRQERLPARSAG